MNLYALDGKHFYSNTEGYFVIRPSLPGAARHNYSHPAHYCDVVFVISRDMNRVFVGGGQWGYDGIAKEIDAVGIEALADRFGTPELLQVLANGVK